MAETTPNTRILIAPAGGGKTQRLVELLRGRPFTELRPERPSSEPPPGRPSSGPLVGERVSIQPRWAVVPDRTQVSGFRRRLADAGGALGVSVGTLGDLYQEILARARRPVAVMPEPARQRLLRLALQQLTAEGQLPFYRPIAHTPGFLEVAGKLISELKRARVEPERLVEIAAPHEGANAGPAHGELARIYADYQRRLEGIRWTDREGLSELAVAALRDIPDLLQDLPLIAVDGFTSFEAGQLEALHALAAQRTRLVIALTGQAGTERIALRRQAETLQQLRQVLPEASVEPLPSEAPEPSPPDRRPLIQLEASLFERDTSPFEAGNAIRMIEARSPAEEAREALRWLKARLIRDHLALDQCAVIAADPTRYGPLLRRAADEFGLPLQFYLGEPLSRTPSVAALMDLLELNRSNWPRRLTLQSLRSPFFDLAAWGFQPGDALALDAASYAGQVVEGLDQWAEALDLLAEAEPEAAGDGPADEERADDPAAFVAPRGAAAARLLESLRMLSKRLDPDKPRSMAEWVKWTEDLLGELGFPASAAAQPEPESAEQTDREHAADQQRPPEAGPAPDAVEPAGREQHAVEQLRGTLRALVWGELVAGAQNLVFPDFLDELRVSVDATHYQDRRPGSPAVDVLGTPATWGGRYGALAVLGLSEGLFPVVEREDPFLDEPTRSALGLELKLGREQPGRFYQAVTRANHRLLLTRPYLADDGEAWEPSPFWTAVAKLLTARPRRIRPESPRPLPEAGSAQELLFWGVRRGGEIPGSITTSLHDRWDELQHAQEVLKARSAPRPEGAYEGDLASAVDWLSARFDEQHFWSPSRLESYGNCPHMFFVSYLLGLEAREPPEAGLDAAQLGSILHEILEVAYREAETPADLESVLESLDRVQGPIMDAAPQQHGFRPTALWAIEREQYAEALRNTVRGLAEHSAEWTPVGLELRFGIGDQPPLELALAEDGHPVVRVRGIIDRLDRNADGELFVIDYKTGASRLTPAELNQGRRIQLPLYSMAAQEALGLGTVVDGYYWAILKAKAGSLKLKKYRPPDPPPSSPPAGPQAAYAVARLHVSRIVAGVRAGAFEPVPPPGGCPGYCPAASWCWRYRPSRHP